MAQTVTLTTQPSVVMEPQTVTASNTTAAMTLTPDAGSAQVTGQAPSLGWGIYMPDEE